MRLALVISLLLAAGVAQAHSRLKPNTSVSTRSTNPGVKTGPCGGLARSATPAQLMAGQTITVDWEETIYHPGRFEFYFSESGDQNFVLLKTVQNNQNNQILPHQFSTTLTLPNVVCQECTLQMIQVMLENPAAPSNYYSCGDMELKSNGLPPPTPTPPANCPAP